MMSTTSDERQNDWSAEENAQPVLGGLATLEEQQARAVKRLAARWRGLWWGVAAIVGYFLLVLAARVVWGVLAEQRLEATIAEYRAKGEPMRVEDFAAAEVADADNAALLYKQAVAALPANYPLELWLLERSCWRREDWRPFESVYAECVAQHSEALNLVSQATALPAVDWGLRLKSPVVRTGVPNMAGYREMGRVLAIAACDTHCRGEEALALRRLHEAVILGDRLNEQQPFLIVHLVGAAIRNLAYQAIEFHGHELAIAADEPARQEAEALLKTLLDDEHVYEHYQQAIYYERLFCIDTSEVLYYKPHLIQGSASGAAMGFAGSSYVFRPMLLMQAARSVDFYDVRTSYAEPFDHKAFDRYKTLDLPNAINVQLLLTLAPALGGTKDMSASSLARRRMAAVALALRMYELDHGVKAPDLASLTPDYLPQTPIDPFDPEGKPIRYLPDVERPRLYSVNENHVDDEGKIILSRTGRLDQDDADWLWFLDDNRIYDPPDPNQLRQALAEAGEDDREVE